MQWHLNSLCLHYYLLDFRDLLWPPISAGHDQLATRRVPPLGGQSDTGHKGVLLGGARLVSRCRRFTASRCTLEPALLRWLRLERSLWSVQSLRALLWSWGVAIARADALAGRPPLTLAPRGGVDSLGPRTPTTPPPPPKGASGQQLAVNGMSPRSQWAP